MSPESREVWARVIYDGSVKTNKLGEDILKDFNGQPITKPDKSYWNEMSVASSSAD